MDHRCNNNNNNNNKNRNREWEWKRESEREKHFRYNHIYKAIIVMLGTNNMKKKRQQK